MAFVIVFELPPSVNAPEHSCRSFPNLEWPETLVLMLSKFGNGRGYSSASFPNLGIIRNTCS